LRRARSTDSISTAYLSSDFLVFVGAEIIKLRRDSKMPELRSAVAATLWVCLSRQKTFTTLIQFGG
jgi:hypothetical protein